RGLTRKASNDPKTGSEWLKSLKFPRKCLMGRSKNRRPLAGFTLCLPGSPKVNAGGACGARRPGVFCPRAITAATREKLAGPMFDELVQWMVQDASRNSRGLKLT